MNDNSSDLKHVVTDLSWLSRVIDSLSDSPIKSDECELKDVIGQSIPVWAQEKLIQKLKNLIDETKVFVFEIILKYFKLFNLFTKRYKA